MKIIVIHINKYKSIDSSNLLYNARKKMTVNSSKLSASKMEGLFTHMMDYSYEITSILFPKTIERSFIYYYYNLYLCLYILVKE